MASRNVFALLTDFGNDFAVASMKGLILTELPDAQVIDIDHNIDRFSILSGAFVIDKVYNYFPSGTIFICIIDPGVGSKREPICLRSDQYDFIGPNNGLFHYLLTDSSFSITSYEIKESFRPKISNTFHGRDLFTPAAIEIAKNNLEVLEPINRSKLVLIPELQRGTPYITYIDKFGNIKTNIGFTPNLKKESTLKLKINNTTHLMKVASTFSEVTSGELFCYLGSNNTLEIAANLASAADILKVKVGDSLSVENL